MKVTCLAIVLMVTWLELVRTNVILPTLVINFRAHRSAAISFHHLLF